MISVVVATFNEEPRIERSLRSIPKSCEIIVVDNCSKDGTVKIAEKYADKIIVEKANLPNARNIGTRLAKGDLIIELDADTVLTPSVVDRISKECQKAVGGVCKIYPLEDGFPYKAVFALWSIVIRLLNVTMSRVMATWPTMGCVFFRKEAFERVGGYAGFIPDDMEILEKLSKIGKISVINQHIYTSCRRIANVGWIQFFNKAWAGGFRWKVLHITDGKWKGTPQLEENT